MYWLELMASLFEQIFTLLHVQTRTQVLACYICFNSSWPTQLQVLRFKNRLFDPTIILFMLLSTVKQSMHLVVRDKSNQSVPVFSDRTVSYSKINHFQFERITIHTRVCKENQEMGSVRWYRFAVFTLYYAIPEVNR